MTSIASNTPYNDCFRAVAGVSVYAWKPEMSPYGQKRGPGHGWSILMVI